MIANIVGHVEITVKAQPSVIGDSVREAVKAANEELLRQLPARREIKFRDFTPEELAKIGADLQAIRSAPGRWSAYTC